MESKCRDAEQQEQRLLPDRTHPEKQQEQQEPEIGGWYCGLSDGMDRSRRKADKQESKRKEDPPPGISRCNWPAKGAQDRRKRQHDEGKDLPALVQCG